MAAPCPLPNSIHFQAVPQVVQLSYQVPMNPTYVAQGGMRPMQTNGPGTPTGPGPYSPLGINVVPPLGPPPPQPNSWPQQPEARKGEERSSSAPICNQQPNQRGQVSKQVASTTQETMMLDSMPGYRPTAMEPQLQRAHLQEPDPSHSLENRDQLSLMFKMLENMKAELALLENKNKNTRVTLFTDLSSYPDDPNGRDSSLDSREYHLSAFSGGPYSCKTFLREAVRLGKDNGLTHKACKRLILRHTRDEAREIVNNEMREENAPLEDVVRALELRFMGLVDPDIAKAQMYRITRQPNEGLHSLQRRLSDRGQMACRNLPGHEKLPEEQRLVQSRFLSLLSPPIRNTLRERQKMKLATGQEQYHLMQLVEEAIIIEQEMGSPNERQTLEKPARQDGASSRSTSYDSGISLLEKTQKQGEASARDE